MEFKTGNQWRFGLTRATEKLPKLLLQPLSRRRPRGSYSQYGYSFTGILRGGVDGTKTTGQPKPGKTY